MGERSHLPSVEARKQSLTRTSPWGYLFLKKIVCSESNVNDIASSYPGCFSTRSIQKRLRELLELLNKETHKSIHLTNTAGQLHQSRKLLPTEFRFSSSLAFRAGEGQRSAELSCAFPRIYPIVMRVGRQVQAERKWLLMKLR